MKDYKFNYKKLFSFLLTFFMLTIFTVANFNISSSKTTNAATPQPQISGRSTLVDHSIFIHSPTYSVLYYKKVYFVDEYDNLLKIYNTQEGKFSENYISLEQLGEIVDVAYLEDYLYILTYDFENEKYDLIYVNLPNFAIEGNILFDTLSGEYEKLSITKISNNLFISLTPKLNEQNQTTAPAIITVDNASKTVSNVCLVSLTTEVGENLFKISTLAASGQTSNEIYIVLLYNNEISFFGSELVSVTESNLLNVDIASSTTFDDLDSSNANISFAAINLITVEDKMLYLITYNLENNETNEVESYSKLYEFAVDVSDNNKKFTSKLSIITASSDYVLTSNGSVVYPVKSNQQIVCTEILYNQTSGIYTDNTTAPISNPSVEVEYKSESEFEYVFANKKTPLLSTPWASETSSTCIIDPTVSPKDLIVIGYGKILGENSLIKDYKYCVFTTGDKNLKGYIKAEDLTAKEKILIENYDYKKIIKVQPETNLYTMPTTIINDNLTPNLPSYVVCKIKDNSRVEIIDTICKYKSNEKIMLKVKVNDNQVGYIEYDKIIKPSDEISFVITNASIKTNNTKIYLNSDPNSPIIGTLDKGYRIRINGVRNTDSGYTSITYNDEFGNEFSGYILTDSIGSDSWTVMQIIGCVLIAINIGLLILILRFKKNNIGVNGAKYIDNEK